MTSLAYQNRTAPEPFLTPPNRERVAPCSLQRAGGRARWCRARPADPRPTRQLCDLGEEPVSLSLGFLIVDVGPEIPTYPVVGNWRERTRANKAFSERW